MTQTSTPDFPYAEAFWAAVRAVENDPGCSIFSEKASRGIVTIALDGLHEASLGADVPLVVAQNLLSDGTLGMLTAAARKHIARLVTEQAVAQQQFAESTEQASRARETLGGGHDWQGDADGSQVAASRSVPDRLYRLAHTDGRWVLTDETADGILSDLIATYPDTRAGENQARRDALIRDARAADALAGASG